MRVNFLHQDFDDSIHRKNQNIEIASNHLMGDKWGIIKSPLVIESWQDSVIFVLTRF